MRRILLLSDTHSYMDDAILEHASKHDEIWHAGDWGDIKIYDALAEKKLVMGVWGNIDGGELRMVLNKTICFICEDCKVLMTHIGGYPKRYQPWFLNEIKKIRPALVVTGHSHILKVMYDKSLEHLHMNPGAIGIHGFHKKRTMLSFEINGKSIENLNLIEYDK